VSALKAFIDDSGSGGDSPWYVLAGYVGTTQSWAAFDEPWRAILDWRPKLDYFKASEAESLRSDGKWAGVSEDDRNERINAFIEVIGKHALRSLYVRVKQQDYNEVIKPYVPEQWDNAYYFLFTGIIAAGTSVEKYFGPSRPIEFVFDNANELEKPSHKLYNQVAGAPQFGKRVIKVRYEDEQQFLPLQAADLLAWQVRRRFSIEESPRPQFEAALSCPPEPYFSHTITRSELEKLGQTMDDHWKLEWAIKGLPERSRPYRRSGI
jgi:hypothetical protein